MDYATNWAELPAAAVSAAGPEAPLPSRMMAARGLAPLSPPDLLAALFGLACDTDARLKGPAQNTFSKLPDRILGPALEGVHVPVVLDWASEQVSTNEALLEVIVGNTHTSHATIERIARGSSEKLSERIATNEARLLAHPSIIEALYLNRNTRMSTATRLVELAVRNNVVLTGLEAFKEIAAGIGQELIAEPADEPLPADLDFREALAEGAPETDVTDQQETPEGEIAEEVKPKFASLHARLASMTISEKIRMAQVGQAAERALLMREPNRLIYMAVIRSPAVSEREAESYAQNRTTPEDVLRYIAKKRDWVKLYTVKLALVSNPRSPIAVALSYLQHLRAGDVKFLSRSKNVPAVVSKAARELIKKKVGGGGSE